MESCDECCYSGIIVWEIIGYQILARWVFSTIVSSALIARFGSGIGAELGSEETIPPTPQNDRNQRFAKSLNGKAVIESNGERPAGILQHGLRWH